MVVNKRKKSARMQGSGTHGWGKNKHRNSGQRGGFGNAGTGKKSDNKKPSNWADLDYFGKHGFVSKGYPKADITISIRDMEDKLPRWIRQKQASNTEVNLGTLGYTKLLSTGRLTKKIKITVPKAAEGAAEKIKAAGGELVVQ